MTQPKWWGDWRPQLDPHTGDLQPTDLIECTQIIGGQPVNTAITGQQIINASGGGTPTGYYLQYQDNLTQPLGAANVGQEVKFRTIDITNGISMVNDTQITFAHTGIYNIQFSFQFQNADTKEHDVTVWLRKNGTDVPGSAGFVSVVSSHGGIDGHNIVSWNYLLDIIGGDYYEFIWSATDTMVSMEYYPAGNPPPSTASAIVTVTQQAGIMAGTGMTALNGLSADVQTINTGTTGTDFNVVSSGTDHQFNIPTASAVNRGLLSTTDWSTFNGKEPSITAGTTAQYYRGDKTFQTLDKSAVGLSNVDNTSDANKPISTATQTALNAKQDTLVSGTSIKTVNSTSLLGSGDIAVQPTLVSGTNVKTINSTSILGPGDITITNSPYFIAGNSLANPAVTGTTANTQAASALVNSSNINAAYNLQIRSKIYKSTGTLSTTIRLYINTANNLTGATLLATASAMTTGPSIQHFWRDIAIVGSQLLFYPSSTASSNDFVSFTPSTFTFAASTNYYFIIAIQHSNTTDSAQSLRLQVLRY